MLPSHGADGHSESIHDGKTTIFLDKSEKDPVLEIF